MTDEKDEHVEAKLVEQLANKMRRQVDQAEQAIIKLNKDELKGIFRPLAGNMAMEVERAYNKKEILQEEAMKLLEAGCSLAESIIERKAITEAQIENVERLAKAFKHRMGMTVAKQQALGGALVGMLVVATVVLAIAAAGPTFGASLFALLPLGLAGAGLGLPNTKKEASEVQSTGPKLRKLKEFLEEIKPEESIFKNNDPSQGVDL